MGKVCRICLDDQGKFISPCLCKGSIKYVHHECLEKWITCESRNRRCNVCSYEYKFGQDTKMFSKIRFIKYLTRLACSCAGLGVLWGISRYFGTKLMLYSGFDGFLTNTAFSMIIPGYFYASYVAFSSIRGLCQCRACNHKAWVVKFIVAKYFSFYPLYITVTGANKTCTIVSVGYICMFCTCGIYFFVDLALDIFRDFRDDYRKNFNKNRILSLE